MPLEKSKDSVSITLTTSTGQDPTALSSGSFNCIQQQKLLPETGSKIQLQPRPGREHIISNYSFRWDLSGFA